MKRTSWVVYYREHCHGGLESTCLYACSAQEAVDYARYELNVYEVVECYKKVNNWS